MVFFSEVSPKEEKKRIVEVDDLHIYEEPYECESFFLGIVGIVKLGCTALFINLYSEQRKIII